MTTTDCQPGRFCPDHPLEPGLLVLIAAAIVGITLFAIAAVLLVAVIATAASLIRRRIARARPSAPAPPQDTRTVKGPTAPPAHLAVMAAALDDWWIVTDPAEPFTGAAAAAHVEQYLLSSGYHVTPNP